MAISNIIARRVFQVATLKRVGLGLGLFVTYNQS